jgi:hypothetical protein
MGFIYNLTKIIQFQFPTVVELGIIIPLGYSEDQITPPHTHTHTQVMTSMTVLFKCGPGLSKASQS